MFNFFHFPKCKVLLPLKLPFPSLYTCQGFDIEHQILSTSIYFLAFYPVPDFLYPFRSSPNAPSSKLKIFIPQDFYIL